MASSYWEYAFHVSPAYPAIEILIAELSQLGFESFVEEKQGLKAYVQKVNWVPDNLREVQILNSTEFQISYLAKEIEDQNWNAEWEQNFEPIYVGEQCIVRAPFHPKPQVNFDIVISPKMSFGTGHHETTYMMLQHMLQIDFSEKKVLDMGCGTGVLAILGALKNASQVEAIDVDSWSFNNTLENVQVNGQDFIRVFHGDVLLIKDKKYDIILANINKNILLTDIPAYVKSLQKGGILLLSGFYEKDLPDINKKCDSLQLKLEKKFKKNNWVAAKYVF